MRITTHLTDGGSFTRTRTVGDWTKERIALLRKLWKTAAPSSEIAKQINLLPGAPITKHACCGKAHRLALGPKPNAATDKRAFPLRSEKAQRAAETRIANGTNKGWTHRNYR